MLNTVWPSIANISPDEATFGVVVVVVAFGVTKTGRQCVTDLGFAVPNKTLFSFFLKSVYL